MSRNLLHSIVASTFAFALMAITAGSAQAVSVPAGTWGVDIDVAVFKANGPDVHYTGSFLFSGDSLGGTGGEIIKLNDGILAASFTWKGVTYTPVAKAKFVDGQLLGLNMVFKHNKAKFQIKFDDFLVNDQVKGSVTYGNTAYASALALANAAPAAAPASAPTPAAVTGGFALLAALGFRRRNRAA